MTSPRTGYAIAVIICAFLLTPNLFAQFPDERISPDIYRNWLPYDIQIQAAASVDRVTLAAWGTTARDTEGNVINQLRMQRVKGATDPNGPAVVGGPLARPYNAVFVVPLADRFLVVWNDRRSDSAGIWAQRVDTNGAALGPAELLSPGVIATIVAPNGRVGGGWLEIVGSTGHGLLLIWNDSRSSGSSPAIYGRRVDSIGRFDGPERFLGTAYPQIQRREEGQNLWLLWLDTRTIAVHDDGRIDPRPVLRWDYHSAYYLGADTSLILVREDSLLFYRTPFSSTPLRTLIIPELRERVFSPALVRDQTRRLYLLFTMHEQSADGPRMNIYEVAILSDSFPEPKYLV